MKNIIKKAKKVNVEKAANELLSFLIGNVENYVDSSQNIYKIDIIVDEQENYPNLTLITSLYKEIPEDKEIFKEFGVEIDDGWKAANEASENPDLDKKLKEVGDCRSELDKIVEEIYNIAKSSPLLEKLFERISFYYETFVPTEEKKQKALKIDEELKILIKANLDTNDKEEKEKYQKLIKEKIEEGTNLLNYSKVEGLVKLTKFEYESFSVDLKVKAPKIENEDGIEMGEEIVKEYTIPEGFTCWFEISQKPKLQKTSLF